MAHYQAVLAVWHAWWGGGSVALLSWAFLFPFFFLDFTDSMAMQLWWQVSVLYASWVT